MARGKFCTVLSKLLCRSQFIKSMQLKHCNSLFMSNYEFIIPGKMKYNVGVKIKE